MTAVQHADFPFAVARPPAAVVELSTLASLSAKGGWRVALPHARASHVFVWVTRGQGRAIVSGIRRGLGANNVLWLPSGTQFSLELGAQIFGQVLTYTHRDPSLLPMTPQHLRIRDVSLQGELGGLMDLVGREVKDQRPLQDEALLAKFILIEVWLRRMMLLSLDDAAHVQPGLAGRTTAAQRLAENFAKTSEIGFRSGRSMADFADDLGVTPTHLTRVCRDVTGMTAADLLTQRVLHEARRLLEDSDAPAQNIARFLGFGSAAYFSRFIQKHTGQAPSQHRKATV